MLFGGTDVETIRDELGYALADSSVGKIVLNVDSPGGAVPGISELADLIYKARLIKPIDAHVSGMGASQRIGSRPPPAVSRFPIPRGWKHWCSRHDY